MIHTSTLRAAFRRSKVLVFGNVQGNRHSVRRVVQHAEENRINNIVSLGRFHAGDCMGDHGMSNRQYLNIYRQLVNWQEASPKKRTWTGVFGKYEFWPDEAGFMGRYMSFKGTRESAAFFLKADNLCFAHFDSTLIDKYRPFIESPPADLPLVLFFAHSYYFGVNEGPRPSYSEGKGPRHLGELKADTFGDYEFLPGNEERHQLEPGKVYWVSVGPSYISSSYFGESSYMRVSIANTAVYDPRDFSLTLRSLSITSREKDLRR